MNRIVKSAPCAPTSRTRQEIRQAVKTVADRRSPTLISPEYRVLNAEMHAHDKFYGDDAVGWLQRIRLMISEFGCESVIDYGCGCALLGDHLRLTTPVHDYDPAIERYSADPPQSDMIVCIDVLEHVEPEYLNGVLNHLAAKMRKVALVVVATREDRSKLLPDGSNPHRVVEVAEWWEALLDDYFFVKTAEFIAEHSAVFVLTPR